MTPAHLEALHHAVVVLDLLGIAVFAATGALVAARHAMDPIGFITVGTATAIGGGTIRDLVLGRPVYWVDDPVYLSVAVGVSLATFWLARALHSQQKTLLWLDAVGMAVFAVAGTHKAQAMGAPFIVCVLMGVMTASFGGVLRDILCGEKPMLFHKEVYATAALIGSATLLVLDGTRLPLESQTSTAFLAAFLVRAAAIRWGLSLPQYRGGHA